MTINKSIASPFLYQDFLRATNILLAAVRRHNPYILLLGESGSGKTTLLRHLQAKLDKRSFSVLYLCHGRPSPSALVLNPTQNLFE